MGKLKRPSLDVFRPTPFCASTFSVRSVNPWNVFQTEVVFASARCFQIITRFGGLLRTLAYSLHSFAMKLSIICSYWDEPLSASLFPFVFSQRFFLSYLTNSLLYPGEINQEIGRTWDMPQTTTIASFGNEQFSRHARVGSISLLHFSSPREDRETGDLLEIFSMMHKVVRQFNLIIL